MADEFKLTEEEKAMRSKLEQQWSAFKIHADYEDRTAALQEMRDLAVKLHKSLKKNKQEPRHHQYMIDNRGLEPDDPEFYLHLHPIEDLIKYTYDPHANDDPDDKTIGEDFDITIVSRRWNAHDTYTFKRTESGWYVKGVGEGGPCDFTASPLFYELLRHDSVVYPRDVGEWFEWLWMRAKDKGLSKEAVQEGLKDIADWINATEHNVPNKGIWEGLA